MSKEKKPNIARVKNEEKLRRYLLNKQQENGKASNKRRD